MATKTAQKAPKTRQKPAAQGTQPETAAKPQKRPAGRPTSFSEEKARIICDRLADGESLRSICRDEGMPVLQTVYGWMNSRPSFLEQYLRAREEQAETHADIIVDLSDATPETLPVYDKEGNVIELKLDSAWVQWMRQRIEARKWVASKLRPKRYGDKVSVGGDAENPVVVQNSFEVFGELLTAIQTGRQKKIVG